MTALIAVVDIGKSNAKLSLLDAQSGSNIWSVKRANRVVHASQSRQLDIVAIEQWLLDMFRRAPHKERVSVIVPIAHGAAAVFVDERGAIVEAPDYEDPRFGAADEDYERQRDAFEETYSPSLPLGLNLGRQFHILDRDGSQPLTRARHALLYPQYWAWRLSGVMASEVTSLGCHTDLWRPRQKTFSALAHARQWTRLFPSLRFAGDVLGTITASVAEATGLPPTCRVSCGIHDSNAAFLEHLLAHGRDEPFCVISSGTWTVTMANAADPTRLRAGHDMLANVNPFSSPVCTARFMGGREYEAISRSTVLPHQQSLEAVLRRQSMAVPSFARAGPFPDAQGEVLRADDLSELERAALATLYVALMSDLSIDLLAARGDIFVDGPLASNPLFGSVLAAWHPQRRVFITPSSSGECARVAAFLSGFPNLASAESSAVQPLNLAGLEDYRRTWRELLPQ